MGMKRKGYFMVGNLAEHIRGREKYLIHLNYWENFSWQTGHTGIWPYATNTSMKCSKMQFLGMKQLITVVRCERSVKL